MKALPAISVAMGVYNPQSEAQLLQAVGSIMGQTFSDWELLLYDDGSPPESAQMIRRAARMDGRIRYLRGESNRGLAHALNACIACASGRYIARMDADDLSAPRRFSLQLAFLESHPQYQWVGSNATLINAQGPWGQLTMPPQPQKTDFCKYSPYIHPSVLFRKEVLVQNHGYCESPDFALCEDYELFLRLHRNGCRGYNLQQPLLQYREDACSYRRRGWPRRVREAKLRYHGLQRLGVPQTAALAWALRPLLAGALPGRALHLLKQRRVAAQAPSKGEPA